MNSFVLFFGLFIFYIVKGILWVLIDTYWFKTEYGNPISTITNMVLWPISSFIRTFTLIKNYINK